MAEEINIIGNSQEIIKIKEIADQIGKNQISSLIEGEPGTGKDLLAKYIFSKVSEPKKFFKIDSSILNSNSNIINTLGENDLTYICIDDIGSLSSEAQAILIQLIDNSIEKKKNLKFIFLSNQIPNQEISKNQLREDLFFRINRTKILIPPLRKRKEDIYLLGNFFLTQINSSTNKKITGLNENFKSFLLNYNWPGNVREFENFLYNSVVFSKSNVLCEDDIPEDYFRTNLKLKNINLEIVPALPLDRYEKEIILKNLHFANFNRNKTAKLLGISERTLYRKLKLYKIETDSD